MKHAYLILIHTNFKIINKLIEFLDDEDNDFYILIDKKVKDSFENLITAKPNFSKVFQVKRIPIFWASYSNLYAQMLLLKASINKGYSYFHYMQGSDFPIKSKQYIKEFFKQNNGKNFIDFDTGWYEDGKRKVNNYHFFVNNRFYRNSIILKGLDHVIINLQKNINHKRKNDKIYSGSALWSITSDFGNYILLNEDYLKHRYKHTIAADEVFIQTLIYNSEFRHNLYNFEKPNANLYFIDWKRRNGSSPYTFTMSDADILLRTNSDCLFARKFDEEVDFNIIEFLSERLM